MFRAVALIAAFVAIGPSIAAENRRAAEEPTVVNLQAQAAQEVANDELVAVLAAQAQGDDPAALAQQVNRRAAGALKAAAGVRGVRMKTGNYQTLPRFGDKQRVEGWQVSQELKLESRDFVAASELIGRLQQQELVVRALSVRLSDEARRSAENQLIGEAIQAFRERAERVRAAMRAQSYRIRSLDLSSGGGAPGPIPFRAMSAGPAIEPGSSQVSVTAAGTIELR